MNHDLTPGLGFINYTSAVLFGLSLFLKKFSEMNPGDIYDLVYKFLALLLVCTSLIINYPKLKERLIKIATKWNQPRKKRRK